ncbi:Tyrosine--tRNA ligase [subsurface metagenome]
MRKVITDKKLINELLSRGVEEVIVKKDLEKKLRSGKRLRVKHGIDPTTKDLHIGYAVVYEKLRLLQEMGHQVVFLIGDFTARFGDPTGQLEFRDLRTKKETKEMAKNYLKQVGRILDLKKTEIRYNGEWYDKMSAEEILRLMSHFTVMRMLERDMFQERIKKSKEIGLHEPVYPVLQAYDSVMLKSDLTVIGTDQLFNELQARKIQEDFKQTPQDLIAMKMLIGTDGKQKMSQSLENYIGITESPEQQYGKVMSIPDDLILHYFELATRVSLKKTEKKPRDAKAQLAREIVTIYHGKIAAQKAEREFNRVFREKQTPSKLKSYKLKAKKLSILDLLTKTKLAPSKAEAKRLVEQGGVKIDGKVVKDWKKEISIKPGIVLQVGKRKFIKLSF